MKTSENLMFFWCFQGLEEGCIGNKRVNFFSRKTKFCKNTFFFCMHHVCCGITASWGSSFLKNKLNRFLPNLNFEMLFIFLVTRDLILRIMHYLSCISFNTNFNYINFETYSMTSISKNHTEVAFSSRLPLRGFLSKLQTTWAKFEVFLSVNCKYLQSYRKTWNVWL